MVGAEAEIVEHEVVVAHRCVVRDQALAQRRLQRRGAHDVGAHRHDARRDLGRDLRPVLGQCCVARQHTKTRGDLPARCHRHQRGATPQPHHRRALKDAHPGGLRRTRQTQRVLERVQVARGFFVKRRHVARTAYQPLHLSALGPFANHAAPLVVSKLRAQCVGLGARIGHVGVAALPVAIDGVGSDALLDQVHRLHRHVPGLLGALHAQLLVKLLLATRKTHDGLAAVSPAGATANAVGFEQHHAHAALRQLECGGQTRKATTDHHHVGLY